MEQCRNGRLIGVDDLTSPAGVTSSETASLETINSGTGPLIVTSTSRDDGGHLLRCRVCPCLLIPAIRTIRYWFRLYRVYSSRHKDPFRPIHVSSSESSGSQFERWASSRLSRCLLHGSMVDQSLDGPGILISGKGHISMRRSASTTRKLYKRLADPGKTMRTHVAGLRVDRLMALRMIFLTFPVKPAVA